VHFQRSWLSRSRFSNRRGKLFSRHFGHPDYDDFLFVCVTITNEAQLVFVLGDQEQQAEAQESRNVVDGEDDGTVPSPAEVRLPLNKHAIVHHLHHHHVWESG
jgi:hypothetical protein